MRETVRRARPVVTDADPGKGYLRVRIAYDSQIFWRQRYGGISRYFTEIAIRIARMPDADVSVVAPMYLNRHLRAADSALVTGRCMELPGALFRFRGVFNEALTWGVLRHRRPDIVHETYYASRRVAPRSALVVLTVYDMIHELRPGDFALHDRTVALKRRAVHRADHVICISERTRHDLVRLIDVDPAKVSVIHLGHSLGPELSAPGDGPAASPTSQNDAPFILFVGDRRAYKHFASLLDVYAASAPLRTQFRLVAFGGGAFTASEAATIRALGLSATSVLQEQGDDDALAARYVGARALIYPSVYEGFGIPVLEAMAHGCPVVVANASSLPEVAGNAAEYYEPDVVGSLARAIDRAVFDDARRAELRRRGIERAQFFSWDRCAAETHALYERLLSR